MNEDKEFISKNNAGFLAASVDNVKDPVLAGINQNTLTADASMLLSRLGYNLLLWILPRLILGRVEKAKIRTL